MDSIKKALSKHPYDTAKIKEYLESEKNTLTKRMEELKSEDPLMQEDRDRDNESITDAYEVSSHDRIRAILDDLKVDLTKINRAIAKIKEGTYGVCDKCGKEIDKTRLEAMPSATVDLDCERGLETHLA